MVTPDYVICGTLWEQYLPMIVLLVMTGYSGQACPSVCQCDIDIIYDNESLILTNCSQQGLMKTPLGIPEDTQYLDLSGNNFHEVSYDSVVNLTELIFFDTRQNENLREIPTAASLLNLSSLYTDKGSTCCIYELKWMKDKGWSSEAYRLARDSCVATNPYKECKDDLINTISLTIYTITVILSLICNPWVILVNLVIRHRRHDPHFLLLVHFSVTNILVTLYAAIFVVYGFMYLNRYQYYMDEWLDKPICTAGGFLLVSSLLHFSFLCMLTVIHFYRQIHKPLTRGRQLSAKRIHVTSAIVGTISVTIASIPFMMGGNYYNNVALCLPFYASGDTDDRFSLVYLALYTAVMGVSLTVIVVLTGIIVHSLVSQNKKIKDRDDQTNVTDQQILRENRKVRKAILIKVASYISVNIVLVVLLLMSCTNNNDVATIGREWFARLCVIQAVVWPIVGSMTHKTFYDDTKRMFQRWNCYDWDKNQISLRHISRGSGSNNM